MKTEEEVRSRLQGVLLREFDRRVAEAQERLPGGCVHNRQQPLDARKTVDGERNYNYNRITRGKGLPVYQTIGLCMLGSENPEEWPGDRICEEPLDAKRCPYFTPKFLKPEILASFKEEMEDPFWVEHNLPEAAALLWLLEEDAKAQLPWWKRVLFHFLTLKVEPVQKSSVDLTLLLPESTDGHHDS